MQCFLVLTCCLFKDDNILPKKELHRSLQVNSAPGLWSFFVGSDLAAARPEPS